MAPSKNQNSFSIDDISGTITRLTALNKEATDHPLTKLATYLHTEFCSKNYTSCAKGIGCGEGWLPKAEALLRLMPEIFPEKTESRPKRTKTAKRKIQLDDDK